MVKRLVVPLDQSSFAEAALPLARGLARQLGVPVSLCAVVDAPAALLRAQGANPEMARTGGTTERPLEPLMPAAGASSTPLSERDLNRLAENVSQAERYLRSIASTFEDAIVDTEVMYGDPAERILSFAETRDDPALIMASHGRSGVARILLGSVAARLVQASRFPVFVVRGSDAGGGVDERQVEKILIPLDQSHFARKSLETVQTLFGSNASSVKLVLLQVVETQRSPGAYEHVVEGDFVRSARQEAESYLEETARQLRNRGYKVECDLSEGRVAERINASAQSFGVDLIAMATHGSNADFRRFVLGSVAEQVLHEADRPLMMVRPPA